MDDVLRIILPLYLVAYFGVAFVWRSVAVWRQTGVNPYVLGKSDNAHDFIGVVFRLTFALIVAVIIVFAFFSPLYQYAAPLVWIEHQIVKSIGLVLLVASLVWTAVAQIQMGASWRIGIDPKNRTELIENGLFRLSRNPIFFGMRLALLGFFLTLPNAVTLLALVLGDVLMQIQVRLEEEFLSGAHGEKYLEYRRRVRRWI
ncbi:MAG TPA: isoprenylcysteine carboxylmethyltransferase family protein [Pyrinomonadaceae bacterium]|nr:isoprenylcysteine carboxylmethyltransferase family protein [Pyrinomonadaceae bacterium]